MHRPPVTVGGCRRLAAHLHAKWYVVYLPDCIFVAGCVTPSCVLFRLEIYSDVRRCHSVILSAVILHMVKMRG